MPRPVHGTSLPRDHTGSSWLHALLLRAVDRHPQALAAVNFPRDQRRFKDSFDEWLVRFEAARVASPERAEIARGVCLDAESAVRFVQDGAERTLAEHLDAEHAPLPITRAELAPADVLIPEVMWEGQVRRGPDLATLLAQLQDRRDLTDAAARAIADLLQRTGGQISLAGQRFALLGAAAELAPTELLLQAGAEVLWVDLRPPDAERLRGLRGRLSWVQADLLTQPGPVAATLRAWAAEGPIHLGLYAYAGGESQEWRLTASMNAILRRLPPDRVASVSMLISPTTPAVVSPEDAAAGRRRRAEAATWKRLLERAGRLRPGPLPTRLHDGREAHVARAIVPVQGASYQAAQYIGKVLTAEATACWGPTLHGEPARVSANMAPITSTRSLTHPVFEAGFRAAPRFHLLISPPATTRNLNGLLMIADVTRPLDDAATPADRAHAVHARQVHGGVLSFPWNVYSGIQVAAVIGFAERPGLLVRWARGR